MGKEHDSFLKVKQRALTILLRLSTFVDYVLGCCQCNQKIHLLDVASVNKGAINKLKRIINL